MYQRLQFLSRIKSQWKAKLASVREDGPLLTQNFFLSNLLLGSGSDSFGIEAHKGQRLTTIGALFGKVVKNAVTRFDDCRDIAWEGCVKYCCAFGRPTRRADCKSTVLCTERSVKYSVKKMV